MWTPAGFWTTMEIVRHCIWNPHTCLHRHDRAKRTEAHLCFGYFWWFLHMIGLWCSISQHSTEAVLHIPRNGTRSRHQAIGHQNLEAREGLFLACEMMAMELPTKVIFWHMNRRIWHASILLIHTTSTYPCCCSLHEDRLKTQTKFSWCWWRNQPLAVKSYWIFTCFQLFCQRRSELLRNRTLWTILIVDWKMQRQTLFVLKVVCNFPRMKRKANKICILCGRNRTNAHSR